jgi:hypothetical protein
VAYDMNHVLEHAEAAGWVLDALDPTDGQAFESHLRSCHDCRAAVAEFELVAKALGRAAPAAEPSDDLEARTVGAVLAAAGHQDVTQVRPVLRAFPSEPATQALPVPTRASEPGKDIPRPGAAAKVVRFPRWQGRGHLLAAAAAVAAAIVIAAVVILPGRGGPPAGTLPISLSSPSGQAASGTATARSDASGSWDITLSVQHLANLGDVRFYECWYVSSGRPGHRQFVSAGTFIVGDNGHGTFTMTSAVDPHQFRTMEITAESPGSTNQPGQVILTGTVRS